MSAKSAPIKSMESGGRYRPGDICGRPGSSGSTNNEYSTNVYAFLSIASPEAEGQPRPDTADCKCPVAEAIRTGQFKTRRPPAHTSPRCVRVGVSLTTVTAAFKSLAESGWTRAKSVAEPSWQNEASLSPPPLQPQRRHLQTAPLAGVSRVPGADGRS